MQTLGIDLSTDPRKVWACEIDWGEQPPRVVRLEQLSALPDPLSPPGAFTTKRSSGEPRTQPSTIRSEASLIAGLVDRLTDFAPGPGRIVGIDAPLGWPAAFVEAVADWDDGDLQGFRKRADLRLRATDRFVHSITGVTPMSVSTDRMGSTAMLLAEVLSRTAKRLDCGAFERVTAIDGIAEVHPAAALRLWTHLGGEPFTTGQYRSSARSARLFGNPRERFVIELIAAGIETGPEFGALLLDSGDAIDALLCALVARAVDLGTTITPVASVDLQDIAPKSATGGRGETIEQIASRLDLARALQTEAQRTAESEGWIHLPRRADLAAALALAPGTAAWSPVPSPPTFAADPYARWSNGDGRPQQADPDDYGPVARFIGDHDHDVTDEAPVGNLLRMPPRSLSDGERSARRRA